MIPAECGTEPSGLCSAGPTEKVPEMRVDQQTGGWGEEGADS